SRSTEGFVLKVTALTGPMGNNDNKTVELWVQRGARWQSIGEAELDPDAWVATFRIPNWDEAVATPYKLIYRERHRDGAETPDEWTGTIQANPLGRPLRMAALTCQNDYAFPYEPVARNVARLKPDLVFFSGDQIYENHGGFGYIRQPAERAILNYLRKFYQFGWAFRENMRDQPTLCLPDDHDVLQGNLWGAGGARMSRPERDPGASILGGYVEPARMVNVVHRTNVSHHPEPIDPTPCRQGISVYYGELVYGSVGFAIVADRQWKSGPEEVGADVGVTGSDEDPQFLNPAFDKPGLVLLGERQERFLQQWAVDWRGHKLKAVLSQTEFASLSTHQPTPDRYLKLDFDSGGWPHSGRNRAIEIMRPSMSLHICGDTHLATLTQHGVGKQRDSNWSFCTPAIAAGWPRWWRPDAVMLLHENRPGHGLPNTGEYVDRFGNQVYVHAVGNPQVGKAPNRYEKAHEKGSGFGFITFDTDKRSYVIEAYRFLIDVTDHDPDNQFPGWPVTIYQAENRGENILG
ncbi:MAG TPA: twin-arginine translocation pathway signal, partial [Verrucomicrobiales bacterium]|nr:twin-arginine translocation pathway signal [Verrucomicrobiales bacterium]